MDRSTIYDTFIESLLVLLLVFAPLAYGAVHPWSIAIFEVAAALMAFFWILKMLSRNKPKFISSGFLALFLILIGYASLQLFFARSIYSWATKTELLKLISYATIFLVTLNTIKTKRQITRILSVIITMGFLMSIFYLMRYFGAPAPAGFINSDHFSAYLGMIIPLSLGFLLVPSLSSDTRPSAKPPRKGTTSGFRPLLFFFALIMSVALFFTMSRGGMFSFIAALLFIALLVSTRRSIKKKGWIILAIAVFIILIIAWLGATPVVERILSVKAEITSRYFGGRLPIWEGTLNIIKDNFIFGTGLGTFNYIFPKYQPLAIINKHYTYAHSDILELLSETGIIGFSLVVVCGLLTVTYLFRRFRQRHDPWVVGMSLCVFGSLIAIFLHSFTDFNLHIPANAVLFAVILALFVSILQANSHSPEVAHGRVQSLPVRGRIIAYPAAMLAAGLLVIYTIAVVRPAMADYYANTTSAGQQGIEAAIHLDPSNAKYHYKLGRLYGKSKMYGLQLAEYQDAVRLNPTNSQYHQSLAWVYGQMKNVSGAQQEFEVAIELNSNYYYPYQAYAIWLFNHPTEENIEKGAAEYRKASELEPKLAAEAIEAYYHQTKDYDLLPEIVPDSPEGHLALREYFLKKGLNQKALKEDEIILVKINNEIYARRNDKRVYEKAGRVYYDLGRFNQAIESYHKAIELGTKNVWTYYWLGENYKEVQKPELAEKYFRISAEMDINNAWPYFSLARLYQKLGKKPEANAMWREILKLKNPDPDAKQIAEEELGERR